MACLRYVTLKYTTGRDPQNDLKEYFWIKPSWGLQCTCESHSGSCDCPHPCRVSSACGSLSSLYVGDPLMPAAKRLRRATGAALAGLCGGLARPLGAGNTPLQPSLLRIGGGRPASFRAARALSEASHGPAVLVSGTPKEHGSTMRTLVCEQHFMCMQGLCQR